MEIASPSPEKTDQKTSSSRIRRHVAGFIVLLLSGLTGWIIGRTGDAVIADRHIEAVVATQNLLTAYNKTGQPLWTRAFQSSIIKAMVINTGSNRQYVAVCCDPARSACRLINLKNGMIWMLRENGDSLWCRTLSGKCIYDTQEYSYSGFWPASMVAANKGKTETVIVMYMHYHFEPSALLQFEVETGKLVGTFWNPGLGGELVLIENADSTKSYVLWANVPNNRLQDSMPKFFGRTRFDRHEYPLAQILFDPDSIGGAAPTSIRGFLSNRSGVNIVPQSGTYCWYAAYPKTKGSSPLGAQLRAFTIDDTVRIEFKTDEALYHINLDGTTSDKDVHVLRRTSNWYSTY